MLLKLQQLPWTMFVNKRKLFQVIPDGESVQMMQIGFPGNGKNFEKFPEDQSELDNFDKFMARFVSDLEMKMGHKLPLAVFDIGLMDTSCLKGEYNFEAIRKNAVP